MQKRCRLLQGAVVGRPGPGRRRCSATVAAIATLLTLSGCGGAGNHIGQGSTSASASSYSTKAFNTPLTVTVPTLFGAKPVTDDKHLLTWVGQNDTRIRFLLPASVYPYIYTRQKRTAYPTPIDPPRDYVQYLMKHARLGVKIDDVVKTRVGGRSATLMSVALPQPSWATEGGWTDLLAVQRRVWNRARSASASSWADPSDWRSSTSMATLSLPGPALRQKRARP